MSTWICYQGKHWQKKNRVTELNEIFINSMPNSWSNQVYVQGFYCRYITLKKAVNMFDHMDIDEHIYEAVVEPSYKKSNKGYATRTGHSRENIVETASSNNYSAIIESTGKSRKMHV